MKLSNIPEDNPNNQISIEISRLESIGRAINPGDSDILTSDDSETAITMAFYSLAWLLLASNRLYSGISTAANTHIDQFALLHCNNILRAGAYLDDCRDGCGYIRMILPLRSVVELSPDMLQRENARYRLESWRATRGLNGICSIALCRGFHNVY